MNYISNCGYCNHGYKDVYSEGNSKLFLSFINSLPFPIKNFMIVSIDLYQSYCQTVRMIFKYLNSSVISPDDRC
ncbi:hypothetical protein HMPREF0102_04165 [Bacteroides sp. 2_1_22]|nr:hypothetical protein HMPREF0102_04165 [Bacteroides sp. 2_1_22]